jgi:hypothetical protein
MDFKDWYEINPFKEKLDELNLTEKEKKILTPVIINSSFFITFKPYYDEHVMKTKRHFVPEYAQRQFSLFFKKRYLTAITFYHLEKELNYLKESVPACASVLNTIKVYPEYIELLNQEMKFFEKDCSIAYDEKVKILNNGKLIGWKFKEQR